MSIVFILINARDIYWNTPQDIRRGRLLEVLLQQNLEQVSRHGLGLNMDQLDQIMQGSVCIEVFIMLFSVKQ